MPQSDPQLGINSWLEEELREQYQHDRSLVDESWKTVFDSNGSPRASAAANGHTASGAATPAARPAAPVPSLPGDELVPMRGAAAAIAKNMAASLEIPLATSQRTIPVKVIDENRQLLNHYRTLVGKSKISYTHLIGWAIVRAAKEVPQINHAFTDAGGEPTRIVRPTINFGVAIDVAGKNGARSLVVPNIKNAGAMSFPEYMAAFDGLVARGRSGKLGMPDFQGTTISITNPGTVGTMGSIPRLMNGQGAIVAVGAMDFPAELRGMSPEMRAILGVGKVMTVTCTYDHRIIQGAESGAFLGRVQAFLDGEDGFYQEIFDSLHIPYKPVQWEVDHQASATGPFSAANVDIGKQTAVIQLIHAYRVRGHLGADLDPLNGDHTDYHPELDPITYGLTLWDLDRSFLMGNLGLADQKQPAKFATLREILERLRQTYCARIGCEYMHIQSPEQKQWLQQRMEPERNNGPLTPESRVQILKELLNAEEFEHFLHARFVGQKRFSLEGAETAVAILDEVLHRAAEDAVEEMVMGMAHRGRLTVLANFVGKPLGQIFAEFEGYSDPDGAHGSGDVKYHLGAVGVRKANNGREITISVSPNPSHLEAVDPVVEGIVRNKQDRRRDDEREAILPILIHGDAAFAGQGVVAETLNLSQLDGYCTGGTIHLIINNQIGFTTLPEKSRSSLYSTDVARMVQAPIFHVNGDDPEAAARVARMAYEFRQEFKKDVVIDMVCYRRHGHNEGDDPGYTQPILYRKIKDHASVAVRYGKKLVRDKVLTEAGVESMRKAAAQHLADAFDNGTREKYGFGLPPISVAPARTGLGTPVASETLAGVVEGSTRFPATFQLHPKLKGFVEKRKEALANGGPIDWAFAEALAFGSLALEGNPVRLSGQDSGRGTFSQRHLAFYDYETEEKYIPLQHLSPEQAPFEVYDSSLSEYAVLGFEFGYSVSDPQTLVLWEAQFGDFCNGAQIMIDQFIATAEEKWGQPSGLVMLLPHGQEGQGPEHSSARMERFLELCARGNMLVANCTTPAQYFHILRRQLRGGPDGAGTRKPLMLFTPKSLLRHPKAVSRFDELSSGGFREVLAETGGSHTRRAVFCTGKVYYDLLAERDKRGITDIAIVRMEQIYPFEGNQVRDALARYAPDADLVWLQEEPRNMGAWGFIHEEFEGLGRPLRYIGRAANASPAPGSKKRHDAEQLEIVIQALA